MIWPPNVTSSAFTIVAFTRPVLFAWLALPNSVFRLTLPVPAMRLRVSASSPAVPRASPVMVMVPAPVSVFSAVVPANVTFPVSVRSRSVVLYVPFRVIVVAVMVWVVFVVTSSRSTSVALVTFRLSSAAVPPAAPWKLTLPVPAVTVSASGPSMVPTNVTFPPIPVFVETVVAPSTTTELLPVRPISPLFVSRSAARLILPLAPTIVSVRSWPTPDEVFSAALTSISSLASW